MSFKKKIIVTNSIILIFFVSLLTYSAIEIVHITSKEQFRDIRSNILNNNLVLSLLDLITVFIIDKLVLNFLAVKRIALVSFGKQEPP